MLPWKFVAQTTEKNAGYRYTEQAMPDGATRFDGTPTDALKISRQISAAGEFNWIAAVSEADLPNEPGWMLFRVLERSDNKGWNLEANALTGKLWYRERDSAVSYALSQAKGHVSAVRVIEKNGRLRSFLLVDQRDSGASNRLIG